MRWNPINVRAEMARSGLLPSQLMPYEDPERGHVDPYFERETRSLIVGFLRDLNALLVEAQDSQPSDCDACDWIKSAGLGPGSSSVESDG